MRNKNTVKIISIISILLILIISFGIFENKILYSHSSKLNYTINNIEADVRAGNFTSARNRVDTLEKEWGTTKKLWSMLTDHAEVDSVTTALARMGTLLETGEKSEALAELSNLRELVDHIPDKYALKLENIL